MSIKRATIHDAQDLTELTIRSKSHWDYDKKQIEEWRDELSISENYILNNHVYKLTLENSLIGFYAYNTIDLNDIRLDFLFIEPMFIGKGYGKILITHFLNYIKNTEVKRVIVDADPNAENFYKKQGFKVIYKLESSIKNRFLPVMQYTIES